MTDERARDLLAQILEFLVDAPGGRLENIENAEMAMAVSSLLSKDKQKDLRLLLTMLDNKAAAIIATGKIRKISSVEQGDFEKLVSKWSDSPVKKLRHAANTLSRILLLVHYGDTKEGINSEWSRLKYPGPPERRAGMVDKYETINYRDSTVKRCEYLVVGSGAGGGVAAGLLAEAGKNVVVVERGNHLNGSDFSQRELEMYRSLYDTGGLLETKDGSVGILAGNCLGGGTTVNWSASFRLPEHVLEGWRSRHFLADLSDEELKTSYDLVAKRIGVHTHTKNHNLQNEAFARACRDLEIDYSVIPLNQRLTADDHDFESGFSCFGDPYGNKQSTVETFLRSAQNHGAEILTQTEVQRFNLEGDRIKSAEIADTTLAADKRTISADHVILAAGALNSSIILEKSGISHPYLGKNLHLHPTAPVGGFYSDKMEAWNGTIMSYTSDAFSDLDEGFGFKLETAPVHPGLAGVYFPWRSKRQHHDLMGDISHLSMFIPLVRDRFGGEVRVSRSGSREILYTPSGYDINHILKGIVLSAKMHFEVGAEKVILPHNSGTALMRKDRSSIEETVQQLQWDACRTLLFSAHQMGCCAMGGNNATHPVDPMGKLKAVSNCLVVDGSVFPEASGVNPMLTIMALAARAIQVHL